MVARQQGAFGRLRTCVGPGAPVSCPSCGASDLEPLAPGVFRCKGWAGDACGEVFQGERAGPLDPPLCDCGTIALGRCTSCTHWVCYRHSALFEEQRFCLADKARIEEARQAEIEAARGAWVERLRETDLRAALDAYVKVMNAHDNPGAGDLAFPAKKPLFYRELKAPLVTYSRPLWYFGEEIRLDTAGLLVLNDGRSRTGCQTYASPRREEEITRQLGLRILVQLGAHVEGVTGDWPPEIPEPPAGLTKSQREDLLRARLPSS